MKYKDLRDFLDQLALRGELKRVVHPIDPYLEMTEICDRLLKQGGRQFYLSNLKIIRYPYLEICLVRLIELR